VSGHAQAARARARAGPLGRVSSQYLISTRSLFLAGIRAGLVAVSSAGGQVVLGVTRMRSGRVQDICLSSDRLLRSQAGTVRLVASSGSVTASAASWSALPMSVNAMLAPYAPFAIAWQQAFLPCCGAQCNLSG